MFNTPPLMGATAHLLQRAKDLKGSGVLGRSINAGINPVTDSIARNIDRTRKVVDLQKRSLINGR